MARAIWLGDNTAADGSPLNVGITSTSPAPRPCLTAPVRRDADVRRDCPCDPAAEIRDEVPGETGAAIEWVNPVPCEPDPVGPPDDPAGDDGLIADVPHVSQ